MIAKNIKQEFIYKKSWLNVQKKRIQRGKLYNYIHQIWKMTCATVQVCILESGSTFDHSDVVQQDISACWLEDRKTVVCTKSLYISSLQHKKHHHHSSWIFLLALLTFWQKRSNLHLWTRKICQLCGKKGPSSSLHVWQCTVRWSWPKQANHSNWDFDPRHWP